LASSKAQQATLQSEVDRLTASLDEATRKVGDLTKATKKGRVSKEKLVESVHQSIDNYAFIYVFSFDNMRNAKLKEVRSRFNTSRIFLGKNKVIRFALGRSPTDEYKPNLFRLSQRLAGNSGLFLTNISQEEIKNFFNEFECPQHARSGFVATHDFDLGAGLLRDLPFSMEPMLRQLGLSTRLKDGVIELLVNTHVCKKGDVLTPEQCKILKIFDVQMAVFKMHLECMWTNSTFTEIRPPTTSTVHSDVSVNADVDSDGDVEFLPDHADSKVHVGNGKDKDNGIPSLPPVGPNDEVVFQGDVEILESTPELEAKLDAEADSSTTKSRQTKSKNKKSTYGKIRKPRKKGTTE